MKDLKQRLITERDELRERVTKLNIFLENKLANKINKAQLSLLKIQVSAMQTYLRCLNARIDKFSEAASSNSAERYISKPEIIVFKKEFEKKLIRLGIKDKFVYNIKEYVKDRHRDLSNHINLLNSVPNWSNFIGMAFNWEDTNEGQQYWLSILYSK